MPTPHFASGPCLAGLLTAALLVGCTPTEDPPGPVVGTGVVVQQSIGAAGGVIELEGARLSVPANALEADVTLKITSLTTAAPEQFDAVTPVFKFEPEGTRFAVPVTVSIPVPDSLEEARVFWSVEGSTEYEQLETSRDGNALVASVVHFSEGFGASPQAGAADVPGPLATCTAIPAGGSCTSIASSLTVVTTAKSQLQAPMPIGGTVTPGRYLLVKKSFFGHADVSVNATDVQHALEFCGGAVQSVATDAEGTRRMSGTFTTSGTEISFGISCPSSLSEKQQYTATSTALFLMEDQGVNQGVQEWWVSEYHRH